MMIPKNEYIDIKYSDSKLVYKTMKTKTTKQMGLILDAKTTNSTETLSTTTKVLINTLL